MNRTACGSLLAGLSLAVLTAQGSVPKPIESPTADDLAGGARVYTQYCARCHGMNGTGGMGPPLARPRLRRAADEPARSSTSS